MQPLCGELQIVSRIARSRLIHSQFSLGEKVDLRLYQKDARYASDAIQDLFGGAIQGSCGKSPYGENSTF
ncbi:hypothetical protein TNCV_1805431 [Trichonephila clavipes]|nr:hypothetical protein TNCV_1805431 [Trichonephila clavipes]